MACIICLTGEPVWREMREQQHSVASSFHLNRASACIEGNERHREEASWHQANRAVS